MGTHAPAAVAAEGCTRCPGQGVDVAAADSVACVISASELGSPESMLVPATASSTELFLMSVLYATSMLTSVRSMPMPLSPAPMYVFNARS